MKKNEIEIGAHYLIVRGSLRVGWRAKVVREGSAPNRKRWRADTVGWWVQRVDNKSGRKFTPKEDRAMYFDGYDRETGLTFVTSRMIATLWKQHLEDKVTQERRAKRAKELRDERDAIEIARVDRFAEFGIEVRRHAHGGLYMETDEGDRLLDRLDGRLERITIEATRRERRST